MGQGRNGVGRGGGEGEEGAGDDGGRRVGR